VTGQTRAAIFRRMLQHPQYLYRPWIPILKAMEGEVFARLSLPSPVLDLACGDAKSLAKAVHLGMHGALVRANAGALPFREGYFQSIISVCAIEHMDDIAAVLRELSRVLAPGGTLYVTVPSEQFGDLLLASRIWRALGFPGRADAYGVRKNARSHHVNVWSATAWTEAFARESLTVVDISYLLSRGVMTLWSACTSTPFKLLFLPFRFGRDRQWAWMDTVLRGLLVAGVLPILERAPGSDPASGGYLFLAAQKAIP
jgi:SAM-dependent methyltransferase